MKYMGRNDYVGNSNIFSNSGIIFIFLRECDNINILIKLCNESLHDIRAHLLHKTAVNMQDRLIRSVRFIHSALRRIIGARAGFSRQTAQVSAEVVLTKPERDNACVPPARSLFINNRDCATANNHGRNVGERKAPNTLRILLLNLDIREHTVP